MKKLALAALAAVAISAQSEDTKNPCPEQCSEIQTKLLSIISVHSPEGVIAEINNKLLHVTPKDPTNPLLLIINEEGIIKFCQFTSQRTYDCIRGSLSANELARRIANDDIPDPTKRTSM